MQEIAIRRKSSLPDLSEFSHNQQKNLLSQECLKNRSEEKETTENIIQNKNNNCLINAKQIPEAQGEESFHYYSQLDHDINSLEKSSSSKENSNHNQQEQIKLIEIRENQEFYENSELTNDKNKKVEKYQNVMQEEFPQCSSQKMEENPISTFNKNDNISKDFTFQKSEKQNQIQEEFPEKQQSLESIIIQEEKSNNLQEEKNNLQEEKNNNQILIEEVSNQLEIQEKKQIAEKQLLSEEKISNIENNESQLEIPVFVENDSKKQLTFDNYLMQKQSKPTEELVKDIEIQIDLVKDDSQTENQEAKNIIENNNKDNLEEIEINSLQVTDQNNKESEVEEIKIDQNQTTNNNINQQESNESNSEQQQQQMPNQNSINEIKQLNSQPSNSKEKEDSSYKLISYQPQNIIPIKEEYSVKILQFPLQIKLQQQQESNNKGVNSIRNSISSSMKAEQRLSLYEEAKQLVNVSNRLLKRVHEEDDQSEQFNNEKAIQVNFDPILIDIGVQCQIESRNITIQTNIIAMNNHATQTKKYALKDKGILCIPEQQEKHIQTNQKQRKNRMIQTGTITMNAMIQTDETRPIALVDSSESESESESSQEEEEKKQKNIRINKKSQSPEIYKAKKQTKQSIKNKQTKSNTNKDKRSNPPESLREYYKSIEPILNQKKMKTRRIGIASRLRSCDKKKKQQQQSEYDIFFS